MPAKRKNGRYYLKRQVPGFGKLRRSLRTDRKAVARRREEALLALAEKGHQEVIQAWLDGDVTLVEIVEARETGSVHELIRDARRSGATLGKAADAALRDKAPDVTDSTITRYRINLDHFREFVGEETPVQEALTTDVVQEFKAHRLDAGMAEETVNSDLGAISVVATYAERKGWIDQRPEIRRFSSKVRISYLESDEIATYMAALRPAFRPLMQLLLGTGMRIGEAEGLQVSDLRLGNCEARAMIGDGKTDEATRAVFVPPWAAETVQEHLQATGRSGQDRIFQIPRHTVQTEHGRAREQIGRPDYTIHDHRHTAAVHLARAGMPLHLLQEQLGHSNIEQTMRYARFNPEYGDVGKYFDRVGQELGLSSGTGHSSGHITADKSQQEAQRETA